MKEKRENGKKGGSELLLQGNMEERSKGKEESWVVWVGLGKVQFN